MVRLSGPGRWRHRRFKKDREGIGKGSEKFFLHIKGQELPMHDPRGKVSLALSYAASPTGADHVRALHDTAFQAYEPNMERIAPLGILPSSSATTPRIAAFTPNLNTIHMPRASDGFIFLLSIPGRKAFGRLLGLVMGGAAFGSVIGPPLTDFLFDKTGSYDFVWNLLSVSFLLSILLMLFIGPKPRATRPWRSARGKAGMIFQKTT